MASSRRRKRVKQESDDDSGGPLATTSKSAAGAEASNDAAVGTAVKRRRLASTEPTGSFTSPSDAKSGTTTVTSTSDRRSRRKRPTKHSQRATSQLSESQANQELDSQDVKAIAVKSEGDDQGNDVHTDASTLSPVSDVDEQQDPSIRRMEDPDRKQEISQVKVEKESEDEQDSAPSRKFTRAEKGKGRATDGVETSKLQEEAALLRAELAKLKSELSESHLVCTFGHVLYI